MSSTRPRIRTFAVIIHPLSVLVACLLLGARPAPAQETVAKDVHWRPSATRDANGTPLPPPTGYEVWVEKDGQPEKLAVVAADTQCVLLLATGSSYRVRVRAVAAGGLTSPYSDYSDLYRTPRPSPASLLPAAGITAVQPNPFGASVAIGFMAPPAPRAGGQGRLEVCDLRGRRVRGWDLDGADREGGVAWDGRDAQGRRVPAGTYLVRMRWRDAAWTRKVTLLP